MPRDIDNIIREISDVNYDELTYIQIYDVSDNIFPANLQELSKLDELGKFDGLEMLSIMTINGHILRIRKQDIRGYIVSSPEGREIIKKFNVWSHKINSEEREW